MAGKDLRKGAEEACPIPPGSEPPRKGLTDGLLNFYDEFFGNWKMIAAILTASSLVLAYSLLNVPPPPIAGVGVPEAWGRSLPESTYTPWEEVVWIPRYGDQTVHEGALVLEGDDVLVVENSTYILKGELFAKDRARLILRNAELYVEEKSWSPENLLRGFIGILFNDSASLEMYNSSIMHSGPYLNVGFLGDSRVVVDSSNITERSRFYLDEGSTINFSSSEIGGLTLARDSYARIFNSKVSGIGCNSLLDMINREPFQIITPPCENCRVEVWNSTVAYLSITLKDCASAEVKPIRGYHGFWNSYGDLKVEGSAFNLTLHDTNVTLGAALSSYYSSLRIVGQDDIISVSLQDSSLSVSNCSLQSLGCQGGSTVEAEDCAFVLLHVEGENNVSMARSRVDWLYINDYRGDLLFDSTLINEIRIVSKVEAHIVGSVRFGENASILETDPDMGFLTRTFEVQTQGDERMLPGVRLTLYDEGGDGVWSGETGREGTAYFNVSFCKWWQPDEPYRNVNNWQEVWRLEATKGDSSYNASVNILSETPIMFTFPTATDQPLWAYRWLISGFSASVIVVTMAVLLMRKLGQR